MHFRPASDFHRAAIHMSSRVCDFIPLHPARSNTTPMILTCILHLSGPIIAPGSVFLSTLHTQRPAGKDVIGTVAVSLGHNQTLPCRENPTCASADPLQDCLPLLLVLSLREDSVVEKPFELHEFFVGVGPDIVTLL